MFHDAVVSVATAIAAVSSTPPRALDERRLLLPALQIKQDCPHVLNFDHKFSHVKLL